MMGKKWIAGGLWLGLFLGMTGCQKPSEEKVSQETEALSREPQNPPEKATFLCLAQNSPIGTERYQWQESQDGWTIQVDSELTMNRFGETLSTRLKHTETLQPSGLLRHFQTRIHLGGEPMEYSGVLRQEGLEMTVRTFGKEERHFLPLPSTAVWGAYGVDFSLRNQPIRPGESRTLWRVEPTLVTWFRVVLKCHEAEPVTNLLGKTYPLYRVEVESWTQTDGQEKRVQTETLWCDGVGKIWKRYASLLEMTQWRMSPAEIETYFQQKERTSEMGTVDFAQKWSVPVDWKGREPDFSAQKKVRYQVYFQTPYSQDDVPFQNSAFQQVRPLDDQTAEITVWASDEPLPQKVVSPVTERDEKPNSLIQSDAPEVVALARLAVGEETEPRKQAFLLENFVYRYISDKNYAQGFMTAAEVVKHPSGDCTEHAVLLAALLRAEKIPARIVQGLVYDRGTRTFVWHVWNEAWLEDFWQPLDATLGRGVVGADHIRMNASDFDSQTMAQTLLPAAQLIGKIRLEQSFSEGEGEP